MEEVMRTRNVPKWSRPIKARQGDIHTATDPLRHAGKVPPAAHAELDAGPSGTREAQGSGSCAETQASADVCGDDLLIRYQMPGTKTGESNQRADDAETGASEGGPGSFGGRGLSVTPTPVSDKKNSDDADLELLSAFESPSVPGRLLPLGVVELFASECGLNPEGRTRSVQTCSLYRMYLEWHRSRIPDESELGPPAFALALKRHGFERGNTASNRSNVVLMDPSGAQRAKDWLAKNPDPEGSKEWFRTQFMKGGPKR